MALYRKFLTASVSLISYTFFFALFLAGCDLDEKCNKLYSPNSPNSLSCQTDCSKHFPEQIFPKKTTQACNAGQFLFISNTERAIENKIPIDSKYLRVLKELSYRNCFSSLDSRGQNYVEACYRGVTIEALRFSQINKTQVHTGDRETGN